MDIYDILLLPKKIYKKITSKKSTLFIGVLLVGIIDMIIPVVENFTKLFQGESLTVIYYNLTLAIIFTILLGFVDVLFFSIPVFDLFKRFKRKKDLPDNEQLLIKVMKVYICVNLLILPISIVVYLGFSKFNLTDFYSSIMILLPSIWASAAISRGLYAIYDFIPLHKKLVFPVVFAWLSILSVTISLISQNWLMGIFK